MTALYGTWRMSETQSDVIVSDSHAVGLCVTHETSPQEQRRRLALGLSRHEAILPEVDWYDGHFICESVHPAFRPLLLAAPRLLQRVSERQRDCGCGDHRCPACLEDLGVLASVNGPLARVGGAR